MSTYILSSCWSLQGMSSTQKLVLISLADQANDDGVCWPSLKKMAARTCLSERAIRDAINWLSSSQILKINHRFNSSNVYTIDCSLYNPAPVAPPAPVAAPPAPVAAPPLRQVPTNLQLEPTKNLHNNNTRASFEKIETQGEYVAKPVRELFNMTLDWKPNQQTFAAITMRNGLPSEYSDDRLAGFVSYWQAEPIELTQGQWENKFVAFLKRPVLVPKEPKPKSFPKNPQPQHDEYITPPLYVKPPPEVVNPSSPERIKEIMDEMRRKIAGGE